MDRLNYYGRKKDDGFTLVELIVVMVIVAVLAAVAVPAFMSYMDKQKREQVVVNAKDCLMAAQSLSSERYIYGKPLFGSLDALNEEVGKATKLSLTGDNKQGSVSYVKYGSKGKDLYKIHEFRYTENGITAIWKMEDAKWIYDDEVEVAALTGLVSGGDGGSFGIVNNDLDLPNVEKKKDEPGNNNQPDSSEESGSSEEPTTEEPTTEEPTTEEPTTEEPTTEDNNKPGGELVINYGDEDIYTGKIIEDEDYWPQKDVAKQLVESGEKKNYDTIKLTQGDVFVYGERVYYVVQDYNLAYGTAMHNGADVIFSLGWNVVYMIDTENVLSKEDFTETPWGPEPKVISGSIPGKLYYSEEENIIYIAKTSRNYYKIPNKSNYEDWFIFKDLNEE